MSLNDLKNKWLNVAYSEKKKICLINYMLAIRESVGLAVIDLEKSYIIYQSSRGKLHKTLYKLGRFRK